MFKIFKFEGCVEIDMKKFLPILLILSFVITMTACVERTDNTKTTVGPTTEVTGSVKTTTAAQATTPATTQPTVTTPATTIATTAKIEFTSAFNPEVVTGRSNPAAGTYTGYESLPQVQFTVLDPENSRKLATVATGYGFGLGKNGAQPSQSLRNQEYFDKYGALAIDLKSTDKVLHLTFDCGYENGYTGKILDTLKAKNVPAAFFCTLPFIKQQPELTTRMIKEGHIVGNHSNTHPVFPNISREEMAKEVQICDNYLRTKFGYTAPYFRFPTGSYSDSSLDLLQSLGFQSVFWSVAYADWDPANQKGTQYALDTVTSRLHPGAVILLHAVSKDNTAALGDIVDWARAQGYVFRAL